MRVQHVRLLGRNDLVPCPVVQLLVGQLRIPFAYAPQVYRQGMKRAKKEPRDKDRRVAKR